MEGKAVDTLFAVHMPVSSSPAQQPGRIPKPAPGSGYKSVQLHDPDGDGTYQAKTKVVPGHHMVAFFVGADVRHTPDGNYPAQPVRLIQPDSWDAFEKTGIQLGPGSVSYTATYPIRMPATSSTASGTSVP